MSPLNLTVLAGTLAKPAESRLLPDGSTVWELDVAIRSEGKAPASVPVSAGLGDRLRAHGRHRVPARRRGR